MKRPGLTPHLLAATLFLATGLQAQTAGSASAEAATAPAKSAAETPTTGKAKEREDSEVMTPAMKKRRVEKTPEKARNPAANPRAELLRRLDRNGDGQLDDTERAEGLGYVASHLDQFPGLKQRFDRNADGTLDEKERAAVEAALRAPAGKAAGLMAPGRADGSMPTLDSMPPGVRDLALKRFDRDGDGKLNDEETKAFRTEYARRRADRQGQLRRETTAAAESNPAPDPEEEAKLNQALDKFASRLDLSKPPPNVRK